MQATCWSMLCRLICRRWQLRVCPARSAAQHRCEVQLAVMQYTPFRSALARSNREVFGGAAATCTPTTFSEQRRQAARRPAQRHSNGRVSLFVRFRHKQATKPPRIGRAVRRPSPNQVAVALRDNRMDVCASPRPSKMLRIAFRSFGEAPQRQGPKPHRLATSLTRTFSTRPANRGDAGRAARRSGYLPPELYGTLECDTSLLGEEGDWPSHKKYGQACVRRTRTRSFCLTGASAVSLGLQ